MRSSVSLAFCLFILSCFLNSVNAQNIRGRNRAGANNAVGQNAGRMALNPINIQVASRKTGQERAINSAAANPKDIQAPSKTDNANFINFCTGNIKTNGSQKQGGSCNGIVMGRIPSRANMISTIILYPRTGEPVPANQRFNVILRVSNLVAGSFTNPANTYYSAPQDLDRNGRVIGHSHITIQRLPSYNPARPLDPAEFVFFKGINDPGDGRGLLSATVENGLQPGFYRVCTMSSASNHQPVIMPVAQRGAQDDCTKFEVRRQRQGNVNGNGNINNLNGGNRQGLARGNGNVNGNINNLNGGNRQELARGNGNVNGNINTLNGGNRQGLARGNGNGNGNINTLNGGNRQGLARGNGNGNGNISNNLGGFRNNQDVRQLLNNSGFLANLRKVLDQASLDNNVGKLALILRAANTPNSGDEVPNTGSGSQAVNEANKAKVDVIETRGDRNDVNEVTDAKAKVNITNEKRSDARGTNASINVASVSRVESNIDNKVESNDVNGAEHGGSLPPKRLQDEAVDASNSQVENKVVNGARPGTNGVRTDGTRSRINKINGARIDVNSSNESRPDTMNVNDVQTSSGRGRKRNRYTKRSD